jgi:hypothetical protein
MIPDHALQHARERLLNDTLVERRQPAETERLLRLERVTLRLDARDRIGDWRAALSAFVARRRGKGRAEPVPGAGPAENRPQSRSEHS